MTLSNGGTVTVNGITKKEGNNDEIENFKINLGGNLTTGDSGSEVTLSEFASLFGVESLPEIGSTDGIIFDQYII